MTISNRQPDTQYPGGVSGTHKPASLTPEDWVRTHFPNRGKLVALAVVRTQEVSYRLARILAAKGVADVAWAMNDQVLAHIYPFHEAADEDAPGPNFFWQTFTEEDVPEAFDACPQEVLLALTPASTPEAYMWRRTCASHYSPHDFPQLHKHLQLVLPEVGSRWRLRTSRAPNPSIHVEVGSEGIIEEARMDLICLRLDGAPSGDETGEENYICWSPDHTQGAALWDFHQTCEPVAGEEG